MVPPTLIGGPLRAIAEFRAAWAGDLRELRKNLITGETSGELKDPVREVGRTPFHLAHQGGPDLEMMTALAGVYDVAAPSLRYVAPHCAGGTKEEGREAAKRRVVERPIRLGQVRTKGGYFHLQVCTTIGQTYRYSGLDITTSYCCHALTARRERATVVRLYA